MLKTFKTQHNMSLFNIFKLSTAAAYQVGQEWYYHTRSVEKGSTLKILKIERQEDGERIFHISVLGLHLIHPKHPEGFVEEALHIPIIESALKASTTKLKNDRTHLPDYEFGYMKWKVAFDHKQAGVFRTPVNEIIQFLEDSAREVK